MSPIRLLRVLAAASVLALAGLLVWHLTHQPKSIVAAVAKGKLVRAPQFRLKPLSGPGTVSLAAFRGKAVVLNFWASDCPPCKKEMPQLQAAAERWSTKPVTVVGIDVLDSKSAARAFARDHGVTYPIGYDPLGDTVGPYGVTYTPTTFFVDRHGRILKRILGPVTAATLNTQIGAALAS
ncbi:MAG TPA: TlpA disulfide reductase family protein [Gaiellaceae bacterium]|nr:TlpA disulfide reductase family protein [Gaiellaceae bacterium]